MTSNLEFNNLTELNENELQSVEGGMLLVFAAGILCGMCVGAGIMALVMS